MLAKNPSGLITSSASNADGLDEAAMERAEHGPAASEVFGSEQDVDHPPKQCVQDHRHEQRPYISE